MGIKPGWRDAGQWSLSILVNLGQSMAPTPQTTTWGSRQDYGCSKLKYTFQWLSISGTNKQFFAIVRT